MDREPTGKTNPGPRADRGPARTDAGPIAHTGASTVTTIPPDKRVDREPTGKTDPGPRADRGPARIAAVETGDPVAVERNRTRSIWRAGADEPLPRPPAPLGKGVPGGPHPFSAGGGRLGAGAERLE